MDERRTASYTQPHHQGYHYQHESIRCTNCGHSYRSAFTLIPLTSSLPSFAHTQPPYILYNSRARGYQIRRQSQPSNRQQTPLARRQLSQISPFRLTSFLPIHSPSTNTFLARHHPLQPLSRTLTRRQHHRFNTTSKATITL